MTTEGVAANGTIANFMDDLDLLRYISDLLEMQIEAIMIAPRMAWIGTATDEDRCPYYDTILPTPSALN